MAKDSEVDPRPHHSVPNHLHQQPTDSDASTASTRTRFVALVVCLAAVARPSWLSISSSFQVTRLQDRVDLLEGRLRDQMQDFVDDLVERVCMQHEYLYEVSGVCMYVC